MSTMLTSDACVHHKNGLTYFIMHQTNSNKIHVHIDPDMYSTIKLFWIFTIPTLS